jgi:hypothetical protein
VRVRAPTCVLLLNFKSGREYDRAPRKQFGLSDPFVEAVPAEISETAGSTATGERRGEPDRPLKTEDRHADPL